MKKINYMDCSFRDGFQSCLGARVKTEDFLPALKAAKEAGTTYFEIGGGAVSSLSISTARKMHSI